MIKPITWSDEETLIFEQELRSVIKVITGATEYSVKELRVLFIAQKVSLKSNVFDAMQKLLELETEFLAAHIKMCFNYCRNYAKRYHSSIPDMDYDDYVQEAAGAILNAVYNYTKEQHFSTYATWAFKNKIREVVRSKLKGLNKLQIKASEVRDQISSGTSPEDAISNIPDIETRVGVRNLLGRQVSISKLVYLPAPSGEENDMLELIKELLPDMKSQMTDIELKIIGCCMQGEPISSLTSLVNPNTGNLYTRQSLSQTFRKLKSRLEEQIMEYV